MTANGRTAALLTALTSGIAALTTSQQWQDWLQAQSRFHHYSFQNVMLIYSQDRDATRVAGFHTWKQLGRSVRKGEKAIWIMAPMGRKADDQGHCVDTALPDQQAARTRTGFKAVPVFDVRQTEGEPLAEIVERLPGEAPGVYGRLVEVARSIGYTVEGDQLPDGVNGDCSFGAKRIRVEVRNGEAQRVKTLVHEVAHAILHPDCADRALAELEAESVAFVVCAALGIDSAGYSFGYVAGWAGGGDGAVTMIRRSGTRIGQTADRILATTADRILAAT